MHGSSVESLRARLGNMQSTLQQWGKVIFGISEKKIKEAKRKLQALQEGM